LSDLIQAVVKLLFETSDLMILEVVKLLFLGFNVLKRDNDIIKLIFLTILLTFVTAAGNTGVDQIDERAGDDKDRVLKHVNNQNSHDSIMFFRELTQSHFLLLFINEENCSSDYSPGNNPFDNGRYLEALVSANFLTNTITDGIIDTVISA